jgi:hypothetical protein
VPPAPPNAAPVLPAHESSAAPCIASVPSALLRALAARTHECVTFQLSLPSLLSSFNEPSFCSLVATSKDGSLYSKHACHTPSPRRAKGATRLTLSAPRSARARTPYCGATSHIPASLPNHHTRTPISPNNTPTQARGHPTPTDLQALYINKPLSSSCRAPACRRGEKWRPNDRRRPNPPRHDFLQIFLLYN